MDEVIINDTNYIHDAIKKIHELEAYQIKNYHRIYLGVPVFDHAKYYDRCKELHKNYVYCKNFFVKSKKVNNSMLSELYIGYLNSKIHKYQYYISNNKPKKLKGELKSENPFEKEFKQKDNVCKPPDENSKLKSDDQNPFAKKNEKPVAKKEHKFDVYIDHMELANLYIAEVSDALKAMQNTKGEFKKRKMIYNYIFEMNVSPVAQQNAVRLFSAKHTRGKMLSVLEPALDAMNDRLEARYNLAYEHFNYKKNKDVFVSQVIELHIATYDKIGSASTMLITYAPTLKISQLLTEYAKYNHELRIINDILYTGYMVIEDPYNEKFQKMEINPAAFYLEKSILQSKLVLYEAMMKYELNNSKNKNIQDEIQPFKKHYEKAIFKPILKQIFFEDIEKYKHWNYKGKKSYKAFFDKKNQDVNNGQISTNY